MALRIDQVVLADAHETFLEGNASCLLAALYSVTIINQISDLRFKTLLFATGVLETASAAVDNNQSKLATCMETQSDKPLA